LTVRVYLATEDENFNYTLSLQQQKLFFGGW